MKMRNARKVRSDANWRMLFLRDWICYKVGKSWLKEPRHSGACFDAGKPNNDG
jgi:hypothetical protein